MRRANTTFVNLRAALDDVDPLVDASKPVAKRLQPFLAQARAFAADAEPTVRDLRVAIRRRAAQRPDRPPALLPAAGGHRHGDEAAQRRARRPQRRRRRDARRLPGAVDALKGGAGEIGFARPYTTDFLGWFDDFSTTGGGFDALGATARGMISLVADPAPGLRWRRKQYQRCPGSAEAPANDGSNVLSEAERRRSTATRATGRVPQVRRAALSIAVLGVCAGAFVLAGASDESAKGKTYKIVFDNAFGLVKGGDFRVGGVNAGQTTDFEVEKTRASRPRPVVTAEVIEPGFGDFRKDATCKIKPQSLIGEYYVDCQPGKSDEKLADGGTVPGRADRVDDPAGPRQQHPAPPLPRALAADHHRAGHRPRRPAGRPPGGAEARPPGPARDLEGAADPRRPEPGDRELHHRLGHRRRPSSRSASATSCAGSRGRRHRRDLRHAPRGAARDLPSFPEFLDELRPTMARLGDLADEQIPLLADLERAAPDLDAFLTRARPVLRGVPAGRALARRGRRGRRARVHARAARRSRSCARSPRARRRSPSRCASSSSRSTTAGARSTTTRARRPRAPPAPDPTAIPGEGGFTGSRRSGTTSSGRGSASTGSTTPRTSCARRSRPTPDCWSGATSRRRRPRTRRSSSSATSTSARTSRASTARTRSTRAPTAAAQLRAESGKPPTSVGERRGEGQPEAGPLPGQRDISKPQIELPPELQDLLDRLRRRSGASSTADDLEQPGVPVDQLGLLQQRRRAHRRPDHRPAPRLPPRAMTRRRGTASIVASPVLVGAVTVLVAIIAVFIAYNANAGLPFVPTYDVKAELPTGNKLVKGNEVRVGGFRVGVVEDIKPKVTTVERRAPQRGGRRAEARQEGRAARRRHPDPGAPALGARPQVRRASARHEQGHLAAGDTVPVEQSSEPLELEDVFSTFDPETRPNIQRATDGFGDAFAGRGESLNHGDRGAQPVLQGLSR